MKRIAATIFCLFCFSVVGYGQQIVGWVRLNDGRVLPVVRAEQRQNVPTRTVPDYRQRWTDDQRFRNSYRRREREPAAQLGHALGDYFVQRGEERRERERVEAARREQERRNYSLALQRESEAHRRAAHAERVRPYSWQAERFRQDANLASMQRARAQAAVQLTNQNSLRSYGVSPVPTRQQWFPPWAASRRQSTRPQSARAGDASGDRRNDAVRSARREFGQIRQAFGGQQSTSPKSQSSGAGDRDRDRVNDAVRSAGREFGEIREAYQKDRRP